MIFDKFVGFVEEHRNLFQAGRNDLFDLVAKAALFHFPIKPDASLPKGPMGTLWEDFSLPFSSVCVEDNASAVFLFDQTPGQTGFGKPRRYIDILSNKADVTAFRSPPKPVDKDFWSNPAPMFLASFGRIDQIVPEGEASGQYGVAGQVELIVLFDDQRRLLGHYDPRQKGVPQQMILESLGNPITALEELAQLLRDTRNFILETGPVKPRELKPGRILRSHDRPVYTLLQPADIRRRVGLGAAEGRGGTCTPHERRAHMRTFRSDRYTQVRGQRRLIPATWVGPSEQVKGSKRYRVLLDR